MSTACFHCGEPCTDQSPTFDAKVFCCTGCKTVYALFMENGLDNFYKLEASAGTTPKVAAHAFDFLDNPEIRENLLDFDGEGIQIVRFHIPSIHCSSCIWVLENLRKLHPSIRSSQVDFPQKKLRVSFDEGLTLKELALLLAKIGYAPAIAMEDYGKGNTHKVDRGLLYKLGVAGFSFGNIMLLSFPEYFDAQEYWLDEYKPFFRGIMFLFSLPVVGYASLDYFRSAYKGLRAKTLPIDVPIALGILTLFLQSAATVILDTGPGYFDSLAGLVFFLLVGRFFQQKTYAHLSFERDYTSYFPIGATRIEDDGTETSVPIHSLAVGDCLLIRHQEIVPVDGLLSKGDAQIDYSFVTGESVAVPKVEGDKIFAGGKQLGGSIELIASKCVSQSYLTQLWGNSAFSKERASGFQTFTNAVSKRFTVAVLSIAVLASLFWLFHMPCLAINVFTSVLIIACPCALALAAPFTLGNVLRFFGRKGFYLKDAGTIERLAQVDTVVFDKTGTLTTTACNSIVYEGMELTPSEVSLLRNTLRASNHPLSRELYGILADRQIMTLDEFTEHTGKGITGMAQGRQLKVGSAPYVGKKGDGALETAVHLSYDEGYKGKFVFANTYREGLVPLFKALNRRFSLIILSGDNAGERKTLEGMFPFSLPMYFNQKPEDKLRFVEGLQSHAKVLMIGDGLNDAGALAQSDVGIAVAEDVNVFSPACDAILDAQSVALLHHFLRMSKWALSVIRWSFILSLCYNVVGLYFAVTAQLKPVIAAILMPLSSISVVVFTTVCVYVLSRKIDGST